MLPASEAMQHTIHERGAPLQCRPTLSTVAADAPLDPVQCAALPSVKPKAAVHIQDVLPSVVQLGWQGQATACRQCCCL